MQCDGVTWTKWPVATDPYRTPRRAQRARSDMPDHFSPVTDTMSPDQHAVAVRPIAGTQNQQ